MLGIGILITGFFAISLTFRIALPYDQVFVHDWIKFTSIDAYYQMLIVDSLANNFPQLTPFSPFLVYPGGGGFGEIHFFNWLIAFIAWIFGLGSPTQHLIDVIGVYFPAILAALTIIPVYFIGKALFNRWAGVIAAALVAVFAGEYLGRSILGFADQHVAETLFTTVAALFLILAIKNAGERELKFNQIIQRDWNIIRRPIIYSLLAGVFLGFYLITWLGGLLFVFIITLYFIIQLIINHIKHKPNDHLGIIGFILFLVALIIFLPFSPSLSYILPLIIAALIPPVLCGVSTFISHRGFKSFYFPLSIIGVAVIFLGLIAAISPSHLNWMASQFSIFTPTGASAATTLEMQPFLSPQGTFSTGVAWGNFTTSFFLAPDWPIPGFGFISFAILIWVAIKHRADDEKLTFFLIWSLIIFVLTFTQRRFAYYLVINIALLSAYLSWQAIWFAGLRRLAVKEEKKPEKEEKRVKKPGWTIYHINTILVVVIVFFFVLFPNIMKSREVAAQARFAPSDAWQESLVWMKENTPEPLGNPDAYYDVYDRPFTYPDSAYGVTSWWDYGYWISRVAHRIPNTNPSQDPKPITKVAALLLNDDDSQRDEIMKELASSYLITDYAMATDKFWAIATWSGRNFEEFIDTYIVSYENEQIPVRVFLPEYYRTPLVRLQIFDGKSVPEGAPVVLSYEERYGDNGAVLRYVTNIKEFSSYQEALSFIDGQDSGNHVIVGINPFSSPIPLEEVEGFNLIYGSEPIIPQEGMKPYSEVKIFEYVK